MEGATGSSHSQGAGKAQGVTGWRERSWHSPAALLRKPWAVPVNCCSPAMRVRFANCVLDTEMRQVLRDGAPVHLSPKAYELLKVLAEARPRALSKDELYS